MIAVVMGTLLLVTSFNDDEGGSLHHSDVNVIQISFHN